LAFHRTTQILKRISGSKVISFQSITMNAP
jgi:hypothetical protein